MARKRKAEEVEELSEEEAIISDDSEDEEAESEEEEEEEEEILEPKVLPDRTTRGARINKMLEDEDSADEEFWKQEFFAEEAKEEEYSASESEQEDVPDSDFSESEGDDDEDEEENEAKMRKDERKKQKVLKPPGAKKPPRLTVPKRKMPSKVTSPKSPVSPNTRAAIKAAQQADATEFKPYALRKSTKLKVEEAEKMREWAEAEKRPKRKRQEVQYKPLTQEELLFEAAQTEIENLRSLEIMQAIEEEVKKKAAIKRARYSGPYVRFSSKKVNDESLMTCEVANMMPPPEMQKQKAPAPKKQPVCVVTGKPARYRDPLTLQPYHDATAFQVLRQMHCQPSSHQQRRGQLNGGPGGHFMRGDGIGAYS